VLHGVNHQLGTVVPAQGAALLFVPRLVALPTVLIYGAGETARMSAPDGPANLSRGVHRRRAASCGHDPRRARRPELVPACHNAPRAAGDAARRATAATVGQLRPLGVEVQTGRRPTSRSGIA
jgi:hypothetical protein